MKVEDFRFKVETECLRQGLPKPEIVEKRIGSIKLRINLAHNVEIDLYFNENTKTLTSALVVNEKRVFGINGYPKAEQWHLHPSGNVLKHIQIKPMTIKRIIAEYVKMIDRLKIKRA